MSFPRKRESRRRFGLPGLVRGGMAPEGRAEQGTKKFPARPDVGRCPGLARGETTFIVKERL
ncbi:MAG: hypothetical protein A3G33_09325 [Omnitrophica bacterium RIFCSPLOWO2_12_FULL_44_17]|uniref:Uncharacterized protein n=1 Tax=Candidatus Danuiimicrobium aquiferis TaxID=1801832 RepID=A0A1G1KWZ8_9BACT|nr:MAG: hypothetical protein A3B72_10035 [Omnitrophica bacterium RIFCSPHIGHO2_02_FULL_45_28]OGW92072.1 MAG: hypothetical protein A3E74_00075 [Omnitrophica bacterium RIFCSPHIGHO2_12_FULL_44_12]OGW97385.1 MAG: hypothetical protein A3G33_09325 [Omnitrophica bacterium RIFCSPLOWO2_12_FULL_44_17]OGX04458.1 MAG: hypothetical protein A3J12_10360 [Omnitrophica bacterium RIFCSPLOWO2_02_FULL_44_11]